MDESTMTGRIALGCCVNAKIKRTLRAAAVVGVAGLVALFAARPFVNLGDGDGSLDSGQPAYVDFENEKSGQALALASDSELEDRAGRPVERQIQVGSGDTLSDVLVRAGVEPADAVQAIEALRSVFNPRALKAGQKVLVTFDKPPHGFGIGDFAKVSLNADPIRLVAATRTESGGFAGVETKRQVNKQLAHYAGTIKSSLFESAQAAGVPVPVVVSMIRALSYDVDFQRDIQAGDGFDIMFEGFYDTKGKLVRHGDILYASMTLSGTQLALYHYEDAQGFADFYNDKGESAKKALLRTPVDGARISSGFGLRRHPILGFNKMHKGIDFAVPTGTPIMVAGDGVVEKAGFNGAYGNYVRVRHSNGYSTAYAHMSRIAAGLRQGRRVNQGQIIGYVGSTGRSTGPHLHYEILQGGKQINPMSVKVPTGTKLTGRDLDRFKAAKREIETLLTKIPPAARIASAGGRSAALTN
ncbi:MAG: peptidoglycan DD-metalloendopeptidase family protein [Pseudomonadota bacterium]